jgi:hypothetical protein
LAGGQNLSQKHTSQNIPNCSLEYPTPSTTR